MTKSEIDALMPYASPALREVLDEMRHNGLNMAKAIKKLDKTDRVVRKGLQRARKKMAQDLALESLGLRPEDPKSGMRYSGASIYRHTEDGAVWEKYKADEKQRLDAFLEAVDNKIAELPSLPVVKAPKVSNKDLANLYTLTDYHIGMYSWSRETAEDWDTEIAEKTLVATFQDMIETSPDSELGILNQQGDFLHWDGLDAVTPTAHNILDADTRFPAVVELAMDMMTHMVDMMLKKHNRVVVICAEGNHDLASSVWLRKYLKKLYAKNKRVEVDDTDFPFYAYLHGKTMLGVHHGHKVKNQNLTALFASEPRYREMWGQATSCYIHTGHYHHAEKMVDEGGGAIVERHPTLAARDAYAARGGYVAKRAAHAITYHKEYGEVSRITRVPIYG